MRLLIAFITLLLFHSDSFSQLLINEFSSKGNFEYIDGETADWIEIINVDSLKINLSDFYISDNNNNLNKWRLPDENLLPNDIILICLSGINKNSRIKSHNNIFNDSTIWNCLSQNENPDSNWFTLDYNDASWHPENFISHSNDSSIFSFFRKSFINKGGIESLIINSNFQDGFIFYINSIEVARSKNIYGNPPQISQSSVTNNNNENQETFIIEKDIINSVLFDSLNIFSAQFFNDTSIINSFNIALNISCGLNSDTISYNFEDSSIIPNQTYYHSNFKLSENETLYISNSKGDIIDSKLVETNIVNISEGRNIDSYEWGVFQKPTPNSQNNTKFLIGISNTPQISLNSGWYDNGQYVTINCSDSSNVFYTLNGNIPDTSDMLYTDTLFLDSTTVLSVKSFKDSNHLGSKVVDRVFFIDEKKYDLPVISILTDSLNLWGDSGIYVLGPNAVDTHPYSGANFWENWNKFSRLIFFDKNDNELGNELFDLKIHGGGTRAYAQKSFRLNFRSRYSGDINWQIFDQKPEINSFNNLNLRNGGGWYGSYDRIRDGLISILSQNTNVDNMAYQPCVLYLNGEFWGQYAVREKVDEHYIENNHLINSESVDMLSALNGIISGSDYFIYDIFHFVINSDPLNSVFYNQIQQKINLENYIDYFIIQTYIKNGDWYAGQNNLKCWRSEYDGKLNYVLYDTDQSFHPKLDTANSINFARNPWRVINNSIELLPSIHSLMFDHLLKNEEFKCRFINRYIELVNINFQPDFFNSKVLDLKNELSLVIEDHFVKWPENYWDWEADILIDNWDDFLLKFMNENENRFIESLIDLGNAFKLDSLKFFTLDVHPSEVGKIDINNNIISQFPYSKFSFDVNCLNEITAISDSSNFVFSHWLLLNQQDTIETSSLNLNSLNPDTIIANFRDCSLTNVEISEDTISNTLFSYINSDFGPYNYSWFHNDVKITDQVTSTLNPLKSGSYHLIVDDFYGCRTISNKITFDCNKILNSKLEHNSNEISVFCSGGTEPYSYEWSIDSVITIFNEDYFPTLSEGSYSVTITDANGCTNILNDTINQVDNVVQVFPNPTFNYLNVYFLKRKNENYQVSIVDINNNLYFQEILKSDGVDNIKFLRYALKNKLKKQGVYFLIIKNSKTSLTKGFVFI